jgi:hypothetical protein
MTLLTQRASPKRKSVKHVLGQQSLSVTAMNVMRRTPDRHKASLGTCSSRKTQLRQTWRPFLLDTEAPFFSEAYLCH